MRRLRPAARRSGAVPAIGARLMRTALVLSGGIALGAFEAGLCAALEAAGSPRPGWLAASSAGAINAAILAGNPPERRVARLREFWDSVASAPAPAALLPPGFPFSRRRSRCAAPATMPPPCRPCCSAGRGCSCRATGPASCRRTAPRCTTSRPCGGACRSWWISRFSMPARRASAW
ncbi:patatin-like phospholipase family protein [Teichococcus aestuarii]|uniref:patatin-like phospholipase family protein n=1 Tax=Teichococcus aestuarii TaxID=568898 RepID=UPI003608E517